MNIVFSFLHPQKKSQCFIWHSPFIKVFFCIASPLQLLNCSAGQNQFLPPHSSFLKRQKYSKKKANTKPRNTKLVSPRIKYIILSLSLFSKYTQKLYWLHQVLSWLKFTQLEWVQLNCLNLRQMRTCPSLVKGSNNTGSGSLQVCVLSQQWRSVA